MEHGPVDVVIVAGGEPKFDGSVLVELARLVELGTIRVLDAAVVVKEADGLVKTLDIEDLPAEEREVLGFVETGTHGLFDADDFAMLEEGMLNGSVVVALAIEHTWMVGFRKVLEDAGVTMGMTIHVPDPIVDDALSAVGA
jgi:hypothetical protein